MVIIVMGVSGSGKSLIGKKLAKKLKLPFYDADDFHPESNVAKMREGIPLTDVDRMPWLQSLARHIQAWGQEGGAVLACSALKEKYREILSSHYASFVHFVYLKGNREVIMQRMQKRSDHYFPPDLLDSQINTLEEPDYAFTVSIDDTPEAILQKIVEHLTASGKE